MRGRDYGVRHDRVRKPNIIRLSQPALHPSPTWDVRGNAEFSLGRVTPILPKVSVGQAHGPGNGRVPQAVDKRAKRACDPCQQRKVKCDSTRPVCERCKELGGPCVYSEGKRVKEQRELKSLNRCANRYEQLLLSILPEVNDHNARRIRKALQKRHLSIAVSETSSTSSSSVTASPPTLNDVYEDGEWLKSSSTLSSATGWIQKDISTNYVKPNEKSPLDTPLSRRSLASSSIKTTSQPSNASKVKDTDSEVVNSYHLPALEVAKDLFEAYFRYVHGSFPIIRQRFLGKQYQQLLTNPAAKPGNMWFAMLNMVFAIGSRFLRSPESYSHEEIDDQVFVQRARMFSSSRTIFFDKPDLQQVQVEALMALYSLVTNKIDRAWGSVERAVHSGMSLGLNLENHDKLLNPPSQEAISQLWWSIFLLEHLLCAMTSRPSSISRFTIRPPVPCEEDEYELDLIRQIFRDESIRRTKLKWTLEANTGELSWIQQMRPSKSIFFFHLVDLAILEHQVGRMLSLNFIEGDCDYVKAHIVYHSKKLSNWLGNLHPAFRFVDEGGDLCVKRSSREQVTLALRYFNARVVLFRYGLEGKQQENPATSQFITDFAIECMRSSLQVVSILPEEVDVDWLHHTTPRWEIPHFLNQAVGILFRYVSAEYRTAAYQTSVHPCGKIHYSEHPEHREELLLACTKAYNWLCELASTDAASQQALEEYGSLISGSTGI